MFQPSIMSMFGKKGGGTTAGSKAAPPSKKTQAVLDSKGKAKSGKAKPGKKDKKTSPADGEETAKATASKKAKKGELGAKTATKPKTDSTGRKRDGSAIRMFEAFNKKSARQSPAFRTGLLDKENAPNMSPVPCQLKIVQDGEELVTSSRVDVEMVAGVGAQEIDDGEK
jgi:hypothetical protein